MSFIVFTIFSPVSRKRRALYRSSRLKEWLASSRTVATPFKSHAAGFRKIRVVGSDHVRLGHRATLLLRERKTICIAQHAQ